MTLGFVTGENRQILEGCQYELSKLPWLTRISGTYGLEVHCLEILQYSNHHEIQKIWQREAEDIIARFVGVSFIWLEYLTNSSYRKPKFPISRLEEAVHISIQYEPRLEYISEGL